MKATVVLATAMCALLAGACSNDLVLRDSGFNLIEDLHVTAVVAPTTSASGHTEVHLRGKSGYAGRGTIMFSGRCGGNSVGIMLAPAQGEVGTLTTPLELPAGVFNIIAEIDVDCDLTKCALDTWVSCDSLYAGGAVVAWDSSEGASVYRDDIPENTAFLSNQTWVAADLVCANR